MRVTAEKHIIPDVSIRWLTCACFEIRIGDFTIVIDPFIGAAKAVDYGCEVIERADLILISHGHWDHITDLAEMMERFHCPVLCGELTAASLARMTDGNPAEIYPMAPNLELDFGGAKVKALFARHTDQHTPLSAQMERLAQNPWVTTPERLECNFFGCLEYRCYMITAPSGLKIMFWGSNPTPEQFAIVREMQPDIGILQFSKQPIEDLAGLVRAGNIRVMIPHHMDLKRTEAEYMPRIDELERQVKAVAPGCTVIHPEHLKWMHFGLGVYGD